MEVDSVTTIESPLTGDTYAEEVIKDLDWDNAKAFVNGEEVVCWRFSNWKLEEKLKWLVFMWSITETTKVGEALTLFLKLFIY